LDELVQDFSDSVLVVHEVDTDDDSKKTQIQTPVVQSFNIPGKPVIREKEMLAISQVFILLIFSQKINE